MNKLDIFVDRLPEIPYIILAILFAYSMPSGYAQNVLSAGFIVVSATFVLGIVLKFLFHGKRPVAYTDMPVFKYDVPSIHAMMSWSICLFSLRVSVVFSAVFLILAVVYSASRVGTKVHSKIAVYVGSALGALSGFIGYFLIDSAFLPPFARQIFYSLIFVMPVASLGLRFRYVTSPRLNPGFVKDNV